MPTSKSEHTLLAISQLQAGYGKQVVLDKVDLSIQRGEWCSLIGPNAVGKSTLLHSIIGAVAIMRGSIAVNGVSVGESLPDALRHIGFACAVDKLPSLLTGRQCLEVYAAAKELREVDSQVHELADTLQFTPFMDRFVDTYSLGTRQKLSVLLALLGAPSLIVLDEVFNGLDPKSALTLKQTLRAAVSAGNCGVLLATHALDIVERFSDTAALLSNGRIVRRWDRDALRNLRQSNSSLEAEAAATQNE